MESGIFLTPTILFNINQYNTIYNTITPIIQLNISHLLVNCDQVLSIAIQH